MGINPEGKAMKIVKPLLLVLSLLAQCSLVQAQFTFTTNNGAITITGCTNAWDYDGTVVIPDTINGWPVVSIDYYACSYKSMTNVTIGNNVTNIGPYAFWSCINLHNITIPKSVTRIGGSAFSGDKNIFFQGNPPAFDYALYATLYYLPGNAGWDQFLLTNNYSGKLWNPQPQTSDGDFGVRTNRFGFNIIGTVGIPIVVEAATNMVGSWIPLQSASLTNGQFYFSDPQWTNHPGRFYRIRSP
jgi:hypothetical protein